jgi:hypothetical protein
MLEYLIDNIFVMLGGRVSTDNRHTYGYKLCSFTHWLIPSFVWDRLYTRAFQEKRKKKLAWSFNFTFCYIDDVFSLNSKFDDLLIASIPLRLKYRIPQIHLEIDGEGRLRTKLYDKTDYFHYPIVNFPFICSNFPAAPTYGVYIYIYPIF